MIYEARPRPYRHGAGAGDRPDPQLLRIFASHFGVASRAPLVPAGGDGGSGSGEGGQARVSSAAPPCSPLRRLGC
ncbi:MAG: hypothetical protein ACLS63_02965 [Flavonifractor plautii]